MCRICFVLESRRRSNSLNRRFMSVRLYLKCAFPVSRLSKCNPRVSSFPGGFFKHFFHCLDANDFFPHIWNNKPPSYHFKFKTWNENVMRFFEGAFFLKTIVLNRYKITKKYWTKEVRRWEKLQDIRGTFHLIFFSAFGFLLVHSIAIL